MAPLYYDGTTSLSHFLHVLDHEDQKFYPLLSPSAWIEAVHCHLIGEALEWAKNDEVVVKIHYNAYHNVAVDLDGRTLYQLLNDRFATSLSHRVDKVLKGIKQESHESIESYCIRVNTLFEHAGGQDRPIDIDQYLDYEHDSCLLKVIDWFVDGLRNNKLRRNLVKVLQDVSAEGRITAVSLESICNATQWAYTTIKTARKLRNQLYTDDDIVIDMSQSCLEETSCNLPEISTSIYPPTPFFAKPIASESTSLQTPLSETSTVYESPSISLQKPSQTQENCSGSSPCTLSPAHTSKPWLTQNWRAQPLPESSLVDESPPVLEQIPCDLSEISTAIADSSDIMSIDEILASGPRKRPAPTTTLPETIVVYESPPVLEEIQLSISEISPATEDNSDTEVIDEILASGPCKWTAASAEKEEVFDSSVTFHAQLKSPSAPHIVEDTEAVEAPNSAIAECFVDVEILNQEVFALAALHDTFSKSPPASYSEDIEISAAVDMPSHEHLTEQDGSAIEAFDSDTELGAPSKNSLIQHTEDSETMEKTSVSALTDSASYLSDSAYTYELPALPAFDLNIDLDFDFCTIDTETVKPHAKEQTTCELPALSTFDLSIDVDFNSFAIDTKTESFGWSRSCTSSISRRTSSVSTCTTSIDTDVTSIETMDKNFYEGEQVLCSWIEPAVSASIEYITETTDKNFYEEEQSSCSVDSFVSASIECVVSENTNFYGGEQSFCSPVDDIVIDIAIATAVVVDTDALTLTASMIKKKDFAWMSLLGSILLFVRLFVEYLVKKPEHKGLPKVKIKKLLEPEHIESRSQIVAGISTKSAYKTALFSGIQQGLGSLR